MSREKGKVPKFLQVEEGKIDVPALASLIRKVNHVNAKEGTGQAVSFQAEPTMIAVR